MIQAVFGGSFLEPNAWAWAFGPGIGTNLGASVLWGFGAGLLGYVVQRKVRAEWQAHKRRTEAHNAWMAHHTAAIYRQATGQLAAAHPHFDLKDAAERTHE